MEQEIFKDIPGWESYYQASTLGRVKSLERKIKHWRGGYRTICERILKPNIDKNGYQHLCICKNNVKTTFNIHILIWGTFSYKPCNGRKLQVDHKDGNKLNNMFDNLQLLSARQNTSKGCIQNGKKTSQYTGVCWDEWHKKWKSQIVINSKHKHLGYFNTELEAHQEYQRALKEYEKLGKVIIRTPATKKKTSKYKGVYWHKQSGKYLSRTPMINNKVKHLGLYNTEIEAHEAYQQAIKKLNLNKLK